MADSATTVTNCNNVGQIETGHSWGWNPVIGHVDSVYSTVTNNYSLEGLNAGDTDAGTQPLTIGTVKTSERCARAILSRFWEVIIRQMTGAGRCSAGSLLPTYVGQWRSNAGASPPLPRASDLYMPNLRRKP
jgi:hypothetical protein